MKTWTILEVLDWTKEHFESRGLESPRLDAEVLIAHALGLERVMLYARFDQPLGEGERDRIRGLVARRSRGEPVAYLVGEKEFWSLPFEVTPAVLIPRPDSETLVELGVAAVKDRPAPTVVDVGTGSGCLAIAIASEIGGSTVYALDVSEEACAVARRNAARNGVADRVQVLKSDLLESLPDREIDLLVANLPYIPSAEIETLMPDVRSFEPKDALDGGPDGLVLFRRLIGGLRNLSPGATIALEADPGQMTAIEGMLAEVGFSSLSTTNDLAGQKRVVTGRWEGR